MSRSGWREKIGIVQTLVTDYENDRLRLTAKMAVRFALPLDVSMDELLHPNVAKANSRKPSRKVLRRLEQIEALPSGHSRYCSRRLIRFWKMLPSEQRAAPESVSF
jgi:hypothetical protein